MMTMHYSEVILHYDLLSHAQNSKSTNFQEIYNNSMYLFCFRVSVIYPITSVKRMENV